MTKQPPEAAKEGVSVEVFVKRLTETGLMSGEEVETLLSGYSENDRPATGEQLAKELHRLGKLTRFQVQAVYQNRTRGLIVGNYIVLDAIGKGGMGHVFKAQHKRMKRLVALKVLPAAATKSADSRQRFQREVEAAAKLSHPNIVTAYDADEDQGIHFLVMEFVDGHDLASLIRGRGPLPVLEALNAIQQAAQGLDYAHRQGIIHRDIKPANLLRDRSGTIKVLDMGLARFSNPVGTGDAEVDQGLTQSGQVMGTLDYMAPEQALDTRSADARADIYSLGCTLHYLLTGRGPYSGDTVAKKILAHRDLPIPALRSVRPDVPEALDALFQRLLAKLPEDRPQTMSEVLEALRQLTAAASGAVTANWGPAARMGSPQEFSLQNTVGLGQSPTPAVTGGDWRTSALGASLPGFEPERPVRRRKSSGKSAVQALRERLAAVLGGSGTGNRRKMATLAIVGAVLLGMAGLAVWNAARRPKADAGTVIDHDQAKGVAQVPEADAKPDPGPEPPPEMAPDMAAEMAPLKAGQVGGQLVRKKQTAWARMQGVPLVSTNSLDVQAVLIPPGRCDMGSTQDDVDRLRDEAARRSPSADRLLERLASEVPLHCIRITHAFRIGAHEITVAQFRRFVTETSYRTDAEKSGARGIDPATKTYVVQPDLNWRHPGFAQTDEHPVVAVSWNDANEFCRWLTKKEGRTFRLPTEAEWEYACRACVPGPFFSGDDPEALVEFANLLDASVAKLLPEKKNRKDRIRASDGFTYTAPVGRFQPNGFGLFDMHGNVAEWCSDWYRADYYGNSPPDDPAGPAAGTERIIRGGSWIDGPLQARSATRNWAQPTASFTTTGFRVVQVLADPGERSGPGSQRPRLGPQLPAGKRPFQGLKPGRGERKPAREDR